MSDYSIWVLEYAYVPQYHMSGIIYGAHNEGYRKLPYGYVVIKGKDRVAMVDVGFNNKDLGGKFASMYGVENWHSPREILAQCGVMPEQVTDIFVTHAHFDHIGGTSEFPNATFYIQEQELSKWIWAMSLGRKFSFVTGAIDPRTSCAWSVRRRRTPGHRRRRPRRGPARHRPACGPRQPYLGLHVCPGPQ